MPTVIIYWSPGRTTAQKTAVIEHITEILVNDGGARKEDILIIFQNIESGDSGRAGHMLTGGPSFANEDTSTSGKNDSSA